MGRKPKTGAEFTLDDLAAASGLTRRAVIQLAEARLLPPLLEGVPADERELAEQKRLKQVATIGAFVSAGLPLSLAGCLSEAILDEFNQYDGEAPSGLGWMARELPREASTARPSDADYWTHQALYTHRDIYTPGNATRADAVIEIADRELVFLGGRSGLTAAPPDGSDLHSDVEPIGRIEDWRRGAEPWFVSFLQLAPTAKDLIWTPAALELRERMIAARENAVGLVRVNVSLAIRNGLDRLAERRARVPRRPKESTE